jgi:hypothetical protein
MANLNHMFRGNQSATIQLKIPLGQEQLTWINIERPLETGQLPGSVQSFQQDGLHG